MRSALVVSSVTSSTFQFGAAGRFSHRGENPTMAKSVAAPITARACRDRAAVRRERFEDADPCDAMESNVR